MIHPADAIHAASAQIYELTQQIRGAVLMRELGVPPIPTADQAQAFIGLQSNLTAALAAFEAEIGK